MYYKNCVFYPMHYKLTSLSRARVCACVYVCVCARARKGRGERSDDSCYSRSRVLVGTIL